MQIGISTASLFGRYFTEDALEFLSKNNVPVAEVFLETFWEYTKKFGKVLSKKSGDTKIHSIHTLTTQFEPQLYSLNERAKIDSFNLLEGTLECAEKLSSKYYTFHGPARIKRTPLVINFDKVASTTQSVIDKCKKHGVTLAYENVHWCFYNYIGYFTELKKRTVGLKATLDIKQARQSGISYVDFLNEMGGDIVTVHLSDIDQNGKMCLPCFGTIDFYELFSRLRDVGFDGAMLIEAYKDDFQNEKQLFESLSKLNEIKDKIF